jgi:hypothetical protein
LIKIPVEYRSVLLGDENRVAESDKTWYKLGAVINSPLVLRRKSKTEGSSSNS